MGSLLLIVLIAGFALLSLAIIMVVFAMLADHSNTLKPPLATLDELNAQIRGKEITLDDLEAELQKRRDAISNIANVQADVDSLIHQRDEVLTEWNQLEERRQEILALRKETEEAHTAFAAATRDLTEKAAELEQIEASLNDRTAKIEEIEAKLQKTEQREEVETNPLAELEALPPVLAGLKSWPKQDQHDEADALHRVANHMKTQGLDYHTRVIRAFHTAMKVNETSQMAVLAGISGTGKSQLPRRYAQAIGMGFLQVPVQPRWDSPQDLMGFYNYIEGKFRPTDLARALYHLDKWNGPKDSELQERMMLVLLDEMNLARVEYYFSDLLSRLESRPDLAELERQGLNEAGRKALRKDAELELDIPMPAKQSTLRIFPGYNILFAGTMNEDESTQSLSDKVVDRANVMRFAAPHTIKTSTVPSKAPQSETTEIKALSLKTWRTWIKKVGTSDAEQHAVEDYLNRMVAHMTNLGRPFGHRLARAIRAYVANYPQNNGRPDIETALADQVEMRLLPKLRGVEMETARTPLQELSKYVGEDLNDGILAKAIEDSAKLAEEGTGQFVWRGVTRE